MVITDIKSYAKDRSRLSIYIDGEFSFVLYKGELSQYKLNCGDQISEELYDTIIREVLTPRAKKRGMNLLMTQDRTKADVYSKLTEGGYPKEVVEEAISYLESFHYIDDERYVRNYIYYKSASMSRKQIYMKLMLKGVSPELIELMFAERDQQNAIEEEQNNTDTLDRGVCSEGIAFNDELRLIEKLMLKKSKGILKELNYNEKQKLFAYLYNKGFSINDIEKVYNYLT